MAEAGRQDGDGRRPLRAVPLLLLPRRPGAEETLRQGVQADLPLPPADFLLRQPEALRAAGQGRRQGEEEERQEGGGEEDRQEEGENVVLGLTVRMMLANSDRLTYLNNKMLGIIIVPLACERATALIYN